MIKFNKQDLRELNEAFEVSNEITILGFLKRCIGIDIKQGYTKGVYFLYTGIREINGKRVHFGIEGNNNIIENFEFKIIG